ncbi:MAG: hypothetical protein H8E37_03625 [Planctomycetes bacterium]|nr:hypothetical protein [Planctomycetota bacterium]
MNDVNSNGQICWIWPFRFSPKLRGQLNQLSLRLDGWFQYPVRVLVACLLIGLLPVGASVLLNMPVDRPLTATALTPLLVASARRDSVFLGLGILAVVFVAHCAAMISVTAFAPETLAAIFPDGAKYWDESRHWIVTGENPEYELKSWVPAHFVLAASGAFLTYTSLGFVLIWEGLFQVDLMNVYVGNLVTHSESVWLALALGWHPWSVCRGVGFLLIGYEVCSFSLERLLGLPLSTRRRRILRWSFGLGFLVLDGTLKFFLLDTVQQILHDNLKQT